MRENKNMKGVSLLFPLTDKAKKDGVKN